MKVTVFQIKNPCSSLFLFIYFFRNYRFWLYQPLLKKEAEYKWIKWQYPVGSNKVELLQENEHSSRQSPENSLNEMEMFLDDLVFSWTVSVKWFGTWTNRFFCFSSIKGTVVPLILPQGFKDKHNFFTKIKLSRNTRHNWGTLLSLPTKQYEKSSIY